MTLAWRMRAWYGVLCMGLQYMSLIAGTIRSEENYPPEPWSHKLRASRHLSRLVGSWILLLALLSSRAVADESLETTQRRLATGVALFEEAQFEKAVKVLQELQAAEPNDSNCAMWLGRAYGRLAERSNWLKAVEYARLTHRYLELAVALDPKNRDALLDLRDFYAQAPRFLGGSTSKSEQMTQEIEQLDLVKRPQTR